jgi:hypothetical protein
MSRNWKEKTAYRYVHLGIPIPTHLLSIRRKWWRYNSILEKCVIKEDNILRIN